jgi:hypothetical protein
LALGFHLVSGGILETKGEEGMPNINVPFGFLPVKNLPPLEQGTTTSNLTLAEGDPLYRQADGTIAKATASTTAILGFAAHAVTGSAGTRQNVLFFPAVKDMILEGRCAPGMTIDLTEAFGKPVGLSAGASGFYVKVNATSTYCVFQTAGYNPLTQRNASLAVVRLLVAKSQWPA